MKMVTVRMILLIIAVLLLLLDGLGVKAPRVNLQSLGLMCAVLAMTLVGV